MGASGSGSSTSGSVGDGGSSGTSGTSGRPNPGDVRITFTNTLNTKLSFDVSDELGGKKTCVFSDKQPSCDYDVKANGKLTTRVGSDSTQYVASWSGCNIDSSFSTCTLRTDRDVTLLFTPGFPLVSLPLENNLTNDGFANVIATVTNPVYTAGKFGRALVVNDSTAPLTLPGGTALASLAFATVSFWVNTTTTPANPSYLFSYASQLPTGGTAGWETRTLNGTTALTCINPALPCANTAISAGQWHLHTHVVRDNSTLRGYVDGVEAFNLARATDDAIFASVLRNMLFGASSRTTSGNWAFAIDDVRVYGVAFAQIDVCNLLAHGAVSGTGCTVP